MQIKKQILKLSNLHLFFWSTAWLMVLVILGTLAQREIGLYEAQNTYFVSWIFWAGPIPLPSGLPTMGLIFIGLLSQLIFKTPLHPKKIGITITHLGAFLLLLGAILTNLFSIEGSMMIPEGAEANYFHDFHKLELSFINTSGTGDNLTTAFGEGWLEKGNTLKHSSLPFTAKIIKFCHNCAIDPRKDQTDNHHGFAKNFELRSTPLAKEESENRPGVEFRVSQSKQDGIYSVIAGMPIAQPILDKKENRYEVELRHKRYTLPFTIKLHDFEKKVHAGTDEPRSFKSIITITDDKINQRSVIQMNEPLRYKGYTLYQSSYIEEGDQQISILTVVKNRGRLFPYISSIIICFGLLIHLLQNVPVLFNKRNDE